MENRPVAVKMPNSYYIRFQHCTLYSIRDLLQTLPCSSSQSLLPLHHPHTPLGFPIVSPPVTNSQISGIELSSSVPWIWLNPGASFKPVPCFMIPVHMIPPLCFSLLHTLCFYFLFLLSKWVLAILATYRFRFQYHCCGSQKAGSRIFPIAHEWKFWFIILSSGYPLYEPRGYITYEYVAIVECLTGVSGENMYLVSDICNSVSHYSNPPNPQSPITPRPNAKSRSSARLNCELWSHINF